MASPILPAPMIATFGKFFLKRFVPDFWSFGYIS
jgi:hypothetical protein